MITIIAYEFIRFCVCVCVFLDRVKNQAQFKLSEEEKETNSIYLI